MPKSDSNVTWNATALASIQSEANDALVAYDPPTNAEMEARTLVAANYGTAANQTTIIGYIDTEIGTLTTELAKVPKSDSNVTWNATALASIQSEANDALVAYDPPTKAELDTAVANVSVDEIQASALADLFNTDSGTTYAAAVAGSAVKEIADNAGGSALTEAGIADAVWDEVLDVAHEVAGSASVLLQAAGAAGDTWATALPGAYGAGTAGKLIGDNINAPIATVDTVVDAIKAKTDSLTFTVAGDVDCNVQSWAGAGAPAMTGYAYARIGAAGAGLTAIPWNAAWDAEVESECTDALNTYDPPTNAEMEARTLVAASYFDPATDEVDADVVKISGSSDAADKLEASAETIVIGAAATGTLSTTQMTTDLTEATDDHYNGRIIIWTSGVLKDQATNITDYNGTSKMLTYTAVTEAPGNGDTFVIV